MMTISLVVTTTATRLGEDADEVLMEQTTELQAPSAGIEAFVTHLYPYSGAPNSSFTFCGLHVSQDPHALMHKGYEQKSPKWSWDTGGPADGCPVCGAPLCPTCRTRA